MNKTPDKKSNVNETIEAMGAFDAAQTGRKIEGIQVPGDALEVFDPILSGACVDVYVTCSLNSYAANNDDNFKRMAQIYCAGKSDDGYLSLPNRDKVAYDKLERFFDTLSTKDKDILRQCAENFENDLIRQQVLQRLDEGYYDLDTEDLPSHLLQL